MKTSHFLLSQWSRRSQRGVALVITLILLAAIGALTVIFLATSRRGRASTQVASYQSESELMAEAGTHRALGELIARVLARQNLRSVDYLVSTSFNNPLGYNPALGANLTNVAYTNALGARLTGTDLQQAIANLYYDSRPPVFVQTNANPAAPLDFRFWVDYDRNGTNTPSTAQQAGEPEFVGVLSHPFRPGTTNLFPHSGSNRFLGRYAWMILPVGQGLSLNEIHNQAKRLGPQEEAFLRNQGVGSYEINLASFLFHVNTNLWGRGLLGNQYIYRTNNMASGGNAFEDALSLLLPRYRRDDGPGTWQNLDPAPPNSPFATDHVDEYADGPLVLTPSGFTETMPDPTPLPWSGSPNPSAYVSPQDLFDETKVGSNFVSRLTSALNDPDPGPAGVYNRATLLRMLEQISVDPVHRLPSQMHLNYDNVTNRIDEFVPWIPERFMSNAVNRMLAVRAQSFTNLYFPRALTNVTLYPENMLAATNAKAPEIFRLMQVAANLYDATHPKPAKGGRHAPTAFMPLLTMNNTGAVVIAGFKAMDIADLTLFNDRTQFIDPSDTNQWSRVLPGQENRLFVRGLPVVVGARKGYPNFNEVVYQSAIQMSRKLEFWKRQPNAPPYETNQLYVVGVSNRLGLESWNSYNVDIPAGDFRVRALAEVEMSITNSFGTVLWPNNGPATILVTNDYTGAWPRRGFVLPLNLTNGMVFLPDSAHYPNGSPAYFVPGSTNFPRQTGFPAPDMKLSLKFHLRYYMLDDTTNIVDIVNLQAGTWIDLLTNVTTEPQLLQDCWATNVTASGIPRGVETQIDINLGNRGNNDTVWRNYNTPPVQDREKAIQGFKNFVEGGSGSASYLVMQSPFNPTRKLYHTFQLQANDPLVHYTLWDLTDQNSTNDLIAQAPNLSPPNLNLNSTNRTYSPWGGGTSSGDENKFNLNFKDPLVRTTEDWDFPVQKFPSVGWMGRVHRGTPWQTIFLKSIATNRPAVNFSTNDWRLWSGSLLTYPTNDYALLEVFTTAPSEASRRGGLPVNQTNIAAWSAVLGGVPLLRSGMGMTKELIDPGDPEMLDMISGINRARTNKTLFPGGRFERVGDILHAPELTIENKYLEAANTNLLSDAVYERVPQQVLSLLRSGEARYAIYSWGQALRPAANAVIGSGPFYNMPTNYAIVGEVMTRTVVRLEWEDSDKKKPRAIVESFQILPGDP